jgi:transposase
MPRRMSAIRLKKSEQQELRKLCRGKTAVKTAGRARALLHFAKDDSVSEIAVLVGLSEATVKRIRVRYLEGGLDLALYDRPISGRPRELRTADEKLIVAKACSKPPEGRSRWTLELLAEHTGHSKGMVQRVLSRDGMKPWREKKLVYCDG